MALGPGSGSYSIAKNSCCGFCPILIRIPFSFEFRIRIQILLDKQKVPDPVSDPTLNIHSFTMPTIVKVFSLNVYFSLLYF
jgi:hypothetical protein